MKEISCKKKSAGVRFHGRVPSNESLEQYQIRVPCVDSTPWACRTVILQAPAQFAGLYSRSLEDFETPWEVVELVRFDDPADHPTPAPKAWLLAMEDWSSLNAKDRVWHYKSRSDDAFFFSVSSRPPLPAPALDQREAVVGNEGQLFFFGVLTSASHITRPLRLAWKTTSTTSLILITWTVRAMLISLNKGRALFLRGGWLSGVPLESHEDFSRCVPVEFYCQLLRVPKNVFFFCLDFCFFDVNYTTEI